jgi:hypothetical protein
LPPVAGVDDVEEGVELVPVVDVGVVPVAASVVAPSATGCSFPKTSTAEIIATKKMIPAATYQPTCLPGKFG